MPTSGLLEDTHSWHTDTETAHAHKLKKIEFTNFFLKKYVLCSLLKNVYVFLCLSIPKRCRCCCTAFMFSLNKLNFNKRLKTLL